jgi:hypothetical protein
MIASSSASAFNIQAAEPSDIVLFGGNSVEYPE